MKKFMRMLAVLICLTLLITGSSACFVDVVSASAEFAGNDAEEQVTDAFEETDVPTQEIPPESVPDISAETSESGEEQLPAPVIEEEYAEETPSEAVEEIPAEIVETEPKTVKESEEAAFPGGYVRIAKDGALLYSGCEADAVEAGRIGEGVVYATAVSEGMPVRYCIAYNDGKTICEGMWIEAGDAEIVADTEAYETDARENDEAREYLGKLLLPVAVQGLAADEPVYAAVPEAVFVAAEEPAEAAVESAGEPVSLILDRTRATIYVGDAGLALKARFSDGKSVNEDGSDRIVRYTSSGTKYATVSEDGRVTAKKIGTVNITATANVEGTEVFGVCTVKIAKKPTKVKLNPANVELMRGETATVTPVFSSGYGSSCVFKTDDASIATIDEYGVVYAAAKGCTKVSTQTYNKKTAAATVTVYEPATEIAFAEKTLILGEKMTAQFTPVFPVQYERDSYSFTVESGNECIEVEADGTVCAKKAGTATVTVRTAVNGCTDTCEIIVKPEPKNLYLEGPTVIGVKQKVQFTAKTDPEDTAGTIKYSVGSTKIATITSDGIVTGKKAGKTTVKAVTYNGIAAEDIHLTVKKAPTSVKLKIPRTVLGEGEEMPTSYTLSSGSAGAITSYLSEDESVATISADGVVKAVARGKTRIKCRTHNGKNSNLITIEVKKAPTQIIPDAETLRIGAGDSFVLGYRLGENEAGTVRFTSSEESVATVDATGKIEAKTPGTATITLTPYNDVCSAACEVTVTDAPEKLYLIGPAVIGVGQTVQFTASMEPEGAAGSLNFKVASTKIAKVDANGNVTGKAAGKTKVRVTTYNDTEPAIVDLTVKKAPTSVKLTIPRTVLGVDEEIPTSYTLSSGSAGAVTEYFSEFENFATISEDGVVKAVAPGTTRIKCRTHNGKTSNILTIEVKRKPTKIIPDTEVIELGVGDGCVLGYRFGDEEAGSAVFSSSDERIAKVDANGTISAVSQGTATITISTYVPGVTATCVVRVKPAPDTIDMQGLTSMLVSKGDVVDLPVPVVYDTNGDVCHPSLTYKSSNTRCLKISGSRMSAVTSGTATVTVSTYNGVSEKFTVSVSSGTVSLKISKTAAKLFLDEDSGYIGSTGLLMKVLIGGKEGVATIGFKSSNPAVATVEQDGSNAWITAVAPGTADITATARGKSAVCRVTVQKLTSEIRFEPSAYELGVNLEADLNPIFDVGTGAEITEFVSSDPDCVSVDETGHIAAHALGNATITVYESTGLRTATVPVRVLPGPDEIILNSLMIQMRPGESLMLNPRMTSEQGDFCGILEYASEDSTIVSVNSSGRITAKKTGIGVVTVTGCNDVSAVCVVIVRNDELLPNGFLIEDASIVAGDGADLGEYIVLTAGGYENGYVLTSSDPTVLSVDGTHIAAKKAASDPVYLTMTFNGTGETSTCPVNVVSGTTIRMTSGGEAFSGNQIELRTYSKNAPQYSRFPLEVSMLPNGNGVSPNLIGTGAIEIEDPDLLEFDYDVNDETYEIFGSLNANLLTGSTTVSFRTFDKIRTLQVNIKPVPKYRALIIGEYNEVGGISNNLPFAKKSCDFMKNTLSKSQSLGEKYAITYNVSNPTKSKVKSLVQNTFVNATDDDISVIYIISHGYTDGFGKYYFGIPAYKKTVNETVYADELLYWMSGIRGKVVLILDSCHSGGFISNCKNQIEARGNLSVLTAQTADKNASFYQGTSAATTIEFLTYAFTKGLGYNAGFETPGHYADDNGDGIISVGEAFEYAKIETTNKVEEYRSRWVPFSETKSSGFKVPGINTRSQLNAWYQVPQKYLCSGASDIPLFVYDPSKK